MLDFTVLPPEVNSARMYTGAGAAPLLTAAATWDGIAEDLYLAANSISTVLAGLDDHWRGPSAAAMHTASRPHVETMRTVADQAATTAGQLRAAAAAYETAHALTVPPEAVTANRTLLATLIATNVLGQNALAIAEAEAQYLQMWAQDAGAMHGYCAKSADVMSTMAPFATPPAAPAGPAAGSAAPPDFLTKLAPWLGLATAPASLVMALLGLIKPAPAIAAAVPALGAAAGVVGPGVVGPGVVGAATVAKPAAARPALVLVRRGGAATLSGLSVPPGWGTNPAAAAAPAGTPPPAAGTTTRIFGLPLAARRPGRGEDSTGHGAVRAEQRSHSVVPRSPAAG